MNAFPVAEGGESVPTPEETPEETTEAEAAASRRSGVGAGLSLTLATLTAPLLPFWLEARACDDRRPLAALVTGPPQPESAQLDQRRYPVHSFAPHAVQMTRFTGFLWHLLGFTVFH